MMDKERMERLYVGQVVKIISMTGEPRYTGKTGIVRCVDDLGQLHGSWGGLALIPGEDNFVVLD